MPNGRVILMRVVRVRGVDGCRAQPRYLFPKLSDAGRVLYQPAVRMIQESDLRTDKSRVLDLLLAPGFRVASELAQSIDQQRDLVGAGELGERAEAPELNIVRMRAYR